MESEKKTMENFFSSKNFKLLNRLVYSRFILSFLLILLQLCLFGIFVFWLESFFKWFLYGSYILSIGFLVYLVNSKGRNEFKLAWLIPVILFPFLGVAFYLFYHMNHGGKNLKKKLATVKSQSNIYLPSHEKTENAISCFPEISDLCHYMETISQNPPYTDSSIQYLPNGETFLPQFLEDLKTAKDFIFLEFFIVAYDESWAQIVDILKQKASQGVEVRLLYDAFGSVGTATKKYEKHLNELGINAKIFLPLIPFFQTQQNNRDHRKIAIIDGKIAYTGGLNLQNQYFNMGKNHFDYWKDNAVRIQGSAIQSFTTMFLQTWNINTSSGEDDYKGYISRDYDTFKENCLVIPYGDDFFNQEDVAENLYVYILNHAKKYVHITSPYVVIDNHLFDALVFAAQRGVDVSILVPAKWDHLITFCLGRVFIKKLIDAGVHVYEYQKGFIHAKTFICDDICATVGSVNLDYRSLFHHFECGLYMHKSSEILKIEKDFQETKKDCTQVTVQSYKKTPWWIRAIGRIGILFAPLM